MWCKSTFRSACCVLGMRNVQKRQTNFSRPAQPCSHQLLCRLFHLSRRLFNYLVGSVSSFCFGRGRWEMVSFEALLPRCATDLTTVRFWSLPDTVCPFAVRPCLRWLLTLFFLQNNRPPPCLTWHSRPARRSSAIADSERSFLPDCGCNSRVTIAEPKNTACLPG